MTESPVTAAAPTSPAATATPTDRHKPRQALQFDERRHRYTVAGRELTSVTKLVSRFKRPFDSAYWSAYKAKQLGITQAEILAQWEAKRNASCDLGHRVHAFAEKLGWRIASDEGQRPIDSVNPVDPTNPPPSATATVPATAPGPAPDITGYCSAVERAYADLQIVPHAIEARVYDNAFAVAGTVDLAARVGPDQIPAVLDWKTNETIDLSNSYGDKMLPPLQYLDDCNFHHYALQLSLYRLILSRHYDFHAQSSALIWLNSNGQYQYLECPFLRTEVLLMVACNLNR